jgi:hypothetical protein
MGQFDFDAGVPLSPSRVAAARRVPDPGFLARLSRYAFSQPVAMGFANARAGMLMRARE